MTTTAHRLRSIVNAINVVVSLAVLVMASMTLFSMIATPPAAPATVDPDDVYVLTVTVALAILSGVTGWRSWRRRDEGSAAFLLIINGAACLMLLTSLAVYVVNL